jgi:hypothetical protein
MFSAKQVLVLDSSGSVTTADWAKQIEAARQLVLSVKVSEFSARIAILRADNQARQVLAFNTTFRQARVLAALNGMAAPTGNLGLRMGDTLNFIATRLMTARNGWRSEFPTRVFVLADSDSHDAPAALRIRAAPLHNHTTDVRVTAIGFQQATSAFLEAVAGFRGRTLFFADFADALCPNALAPAFDDICIIPEGKPKKKTKTKTQAKHTLLECRILENDQVSFIFPCTLKFHSNFGFHSRLLSQISTSATPMYAEPR